MNTEGTLSSVLNALLDLRVAETRIGTGLGHNEMDV